mgnify:CR=1 FL=1
MKIDDYLPALEEEIGPAANIEEWVPGVFFIGNVPKYSGWSSMAWRLMS